MHPDDKCVIRDTAERRATASGIFLPFCFASIHNVMYVSMQQQERHNGGGGRETEDVVVSKFLQVQSQSFRNFNESENIDGGRERWGRLHLWDRGAMRKGPPPKKASDSAIKHTHTHTSEANRSCLITHSHTHTHK